MIEPVNAEAGPGYLPLPTAVAQYVPPRLPEDETVRAAGAAWLERIEAALRAWAPGQPQVLDLTGTSPAEQKFLKEVLGSGEVSAVAFGEPDVQVEETIFTGLWRVRGQGLDYLEVADIPAVLRERSTAPALELPAAETVPETVNNAPHVLAEIASRSQKFRATGDTHNFNLDLVPLTDADLTWLVATLGEGPVVIVSAGYGSCRIRSTNAHAVWWVQFSNASDQLILNALDISEVPEVARAAADDIADSAKRVADLRNVAL
jgi:hydrogenase-1 operon protein HyaF